MRAGFFLLLWIQLFAFSAHGLQCRDIFLFSPQNVEQFPIRDIYAGQNSVGYEYAFFKALRDADINVERKWKDLSNRNKQDIERSLIKELDYGVPVIIDPRGRVFSVDQHHDMYALLALLGKSANPRITLHVLRDFSKETITMEEFKEVVRRNGWVYEKNIDDVLNRPMRVDELTNSIERSVVGMAFAAVASKQDIPLKGKFFSPFVQFQLADFMQLTNLISFGKEFRQSDVDRVVELIFKDASVRQFLAAKLVDDAPKSLQKFLSDN